MTPERLRVAIVHHGFVPTYRVGFYERLAAASDVEYVVFHGQAPRSTGHHAAEGPLAFPNAGGNPFRYEAGRSDVRIGDIVSPMRYNIQLRTRHFGWHAQHRDLIDADFTGGRRGRVAAEPVPVVGRRIDVAGEVLKSRWGLTTMDLRRLHGHD